MARETGLEPAASAVTGRRSNQLSYSRKPERNGRLNGARVTSMRIGYVSRGVKLLDVPPLPDCIAFPTAETHLPLPLRSTHERAQSYMRPKRRCSMWSSESGPGPATASQPNSYM